MFRDPKEIIILQYSLCLSAVGESQSASSVLASLSEQAGLKQSELDPHPVRSAMKQLLRSLDQLCPFEHDGATSRPDYMRSFLDYINMLASVLVRCLGSEGRFLMQKFHFTHEVFCKMSLCVCIQIRVQL